MNTLQPLTLEQANENSQAIFTNIKSKIGMLRNLYATMGTSYQLLGGFLTFTETLKSGEFSNKEYELDADFADFHDSMFAIALSAPRIGTPSYGGSRAPVR